MQQRPLDRLLERLLELCLAADVLPPRARHLQLNFAQCARAHDRQRSPHIFHAHQTPASAATLALGTSV
eukprot:317401-Prymnesium_polylepis.1